MAACHCREKYGNDSAFQLCHVLFVSVTGGQLAQVFEVGKGTDVIRIPAECFPVPVNRSVCSPIQKIALRIITLVISSGGFDLVPQLPVLPDVSSSGIIS